MKTKKYMKELLSDAFNANLKTIKEALKTTPTPSSKGENKPTTTGERIKGDWSFLQKPLRQPMKTAAEEKCMYCKQTVHRTSCPHFKSAIKECAKTFEPPEQPESWEKRFDELELEDDMVVTYDC
jgi:hypothetical protein